MHKPNQTAFGTVELAWDPNLLYPKTNFLARRCESYQIF